MRRQVRLRGLLRWMVDLPHEYSICVLRHFSSCQLRHSGIPNMDRKGSISNSYACVVAYKPSLIAELHLYDILESLTFFFRAFTDLRHNYVLQIWGRIMHSYMIDFQCWA